MKKRVVRCAGSGSRDVAVGAAVAAAGGGEGGVVRANGGRVDYARVAAAVRLAGAISGALPSAVAPRGAARLTNTSTWQWGVGASERVNGAGGNGGLGGGAGGRVVGPSHGRYVDALGTPTGQYPKKKQAQQPQAVQHPGGWWGQGTYTQSLRTSGGAFGGFGSSGNKTNSSNNLPQHRHGWSDVMDGGGSALSASVAAVGAVSGDGSDDDGEGEARAPTPNPIETIWTSLVKPLRDFGFGRTNIWEGGVGLFIIGGLGVVGLCLNWVIGKGRASAE
jgi:hypothetical protein